MSYLFNILELGLIYSLLSLGVYITYGILNFPDLGVDGVICLGGAITACLINKNINVFVAMIISVFFGMIAGFVTGFLHVKFKINDLICGIITTTCLYSINLVIMNKKANLSLIGHDAIFSLSGLNFIPGKYKIIIIMLLICVIIKLLINFIMDSVFGLFLRCVGSNEKLVCAFGGNANKFKIIGLMISNGLVALCGSIIVQYQGFCDIGMSIGALVLGLTMVILAFAAFASIASNVGITAALSLISFLAVMKLLIANAEALKKMFGSLENALQYIADVAKSAIRYVYNGFKQAAEDMKENELLAKLMGGSALTIVAGLT